MKNKLNFFAAISIIFLLPSCVGEKEDKTNNTVSKPIEIKQLDTSTKYYDRYYEVYTLEGCEYIVVSPGNSHFTWGTHKGNCKNSIHYNEK